MSNLFKLNLKDLSKGAIVAVISAVLVYLKQVLYGGAFDIKALGVVSLTAFIAYLIKNFASDETGSFLSVM